jgi:hypothetical protein
MGRILMDLVKVAIYWLGVEDEPLVILKDGTNITCDIVV